MSTDLAISKEAQAALAQRIALTEAVAEEILDNLKLGMFERASAEYAGIDWRVYRTWKQWAEQGAQPYEAFFRRVMAAKRDCVKNALLTVQAGGREWKSASWWLERVHPYYREGNTTDDPPPAPPIETIVREVQARFGADEIAAIVAALSTGDPLMALLPSGGPPGAGDAEDDSAEEDSAEEESADE